MLILTRRIKESIIIGDDIHLTVTDARQGVVTLSIEAPKEIKIVRQEALKNKQASVVLEEEK